LINLSINEIYNILFGIKNYFNVDIFIEGFSTDTRTIKKDQVFVAIKGEHLDGHNYIKNALEKSACLVISEQKYENKKVIVVNDSIKALGDIAKYYRKKFNIPLIAITGSVGKTSTKKMITSVLESKMNVHSTKGNLNNHIGLPMTLFNINDTTDISVIEMGMNHLNEIDYLSSIALPTIGVITNIGTSHIGNLGSKKNIFRAKLEILNHIKEGSDIYINGDDEFLKKLKDNKKYHFITYGFNKENDYNISEYTILNDGSCTFKINNEQYKIPVIGKHNVYNASVAIIIGKSFNLTYNNIILGLKNYSNEKMRMETYIKGKFTIINDAYNANTQSMKAAIDVLKEYKQRKIAILGDMLELGTFSQKSHEEIGKYIAKSNIDILVAIGKEAQNYLNGAIRENMKRENIYIFETLIDIDSKINDIIQDNDVILIKGSRGSKMENVLKYIKFER